MDGEIVVSRRRQWTPEEKAALMAEVEAEGGRVLMVARRHGISKSLLYNWRSAWKAAKRATPAVEFVQLGVVTDASGQSRTMPVAPEAGRPRGAGLAADSGDVAWSFRDHVARCSDMMSLA